MAVNVKMGVDIGSFKAGIKEGQTMLKGLNAQMKSAEAEFKATGNAEKLMSDKTKTLNSQLTVQKGIVDQAQKALETMTKAGVDPADQAYQQLYATMMNAQAGMYQTQAAINNLGATTEQAATGADKLTNSVNSIGKKISLDQVITGIGKITDGLENAAKKAVRLGEDIWNSIMDSAKWADDTATMAQMYGIDLDEFLRMQKLVTNGMDTTVEAILKAQSKLRKGIGSENNSVAEALDEIGVSYEKIIGYDKYGGKITEARDQLELFFEAGQKLMTLGDENQQEDIAQKLFGRSWRELSDLFSKYHNVEEYRQALDGLTVNSEESVSNLAALNDSVSALQGNLQTLWTEIIGNMAPALTDLSNSLNGVLEEINKYLKTPEGKEMLQSLGDSVSSLFEDLGKIDPESVVESFTSVFNSLVGGLKWIVNNKNALVDALKYVVMGWGALRLTGGALEVLRLVNGLQGMRGGGGGTNTPTTGSDATTAASAGSNAITVWAGNLAGIIPKISSWVSTNGGPVWDWLTHESPFGSLFQGTESIGDWFKRVTGDVAKNASTFADDWAGVFKNILNMLGLGGADQDYLDFEEELRNRINEDMNAEPFDFVAEPEVPEDAAEQIKKQVGEVNLPVNLVFGGRGLGAGGRGLGTGGLDGIIYMEHANGLPFVPYDGYLASLHRGERVVPAREVSSNSFSSNLYIESMIMSSGTDAEGLAAAMAAAQRRTMSGYGS